MNRTTIISLLAIALAIAITCNAKLICIGEKNYTPIEKLLTAGRNYYDGCAFSDCGEGDSIIGKYHIYSYLSQDSSRITAYDVDENYKVRVEPYALVRLFIIQDINTAARDTFIVNRGIYDYSPWLKSWRYKVEQYTIGGPANISVQNDTCTIRLALFVTDTDMYDMFKLKYCDGKYEFSEVDETFDGNDIWDEEDEQ